MRTFVGQGGSAIRKLRRLCVGCEVDLSAVAAAAEGGGGGGGGEVSLLAEDEAKLAAALGLVQKWIRQQQVGRRIGPGAVCTLGAREQKRVVAAAAAAAATATDWIGAGKKLLRGWKRAEVSPALARGER